MKTLKEINIIRVPDEPNKIYIIRKNAEGLVYLTEYGDWSERNRMAGKFKIPEVPPGWNEIKQQWE